MDEPSGDTEQSKLDKELTEMKAVELRMDEIDKKVASPKMRAERVYHLLRTHDPKLTNWDLICFAVEYLVSQIPVYDWLKVPASFVARIVYTAHYLRFDETFSDVATEKPI